jgi:N-formylglutamate amidohydrolase
MSAIPLALAFTLLQSGPDPLVGVRRGDLPVVITAPHGGRRPLLGVPLRTGDGVAKFVVVNDTNTDVLAEKVAAAIEKATGKPPHLVVARFERKYCDLNRPADTAYESVGAKPAYDAYHAAVREACERVTKEYGTGLLLDLHGQAAKADAIFRGTQNGKTVKLLTDRHGAKAITGPESVQGRLEKKGYNFFPAAESSELEDRRFNGGYTVATYGTTSGLDAIQFELGGDSRSRKALDTTAADLADAVMAFAEAFLPKDKKK